MHPLGLCNNNDEEDLYEYGWVGVVKLEQPELDPSCLTVLGKVGKACFSGSLTVSVIEYVGTSRIFLRKSFILRDREGGLNSPSGLSLVLWPHASPPSSSALKPLWSL